MSRGLGVGGLGLTGDSGGGWIRTESSDSVRSGVADLEVAREDTCEAHSSSVSSGSASSWGGDGGKLVFGGLWKGMSVGEIYLREVEGPAPVVSVGSSSIGVIGGGGVTGGGGDVVGGLLGGWLASRFGRRLRWPRRDEDSDPIAGVLRGEMASTPPGIISPPAWSNILPRSLP